MVDIIEISRKAGTRIITLANEKSGGDSKEQLIFPKKIQKEGTKEIRRISEQELRVLFIEEFKIKYPNLYYSIETPTTGKFSLGKHYETIKIENEGQSASHDMCIFEKISGSYKRIMNVEFKHRNSGIKNTGKDILKLMREEQNGAFIHLLENSNSGTLISVFKKLAHCFTDFQNTWNNENKSIQLVLISLEQKKMIYRKFSKTDFTNLNNLFSLKQKKGSFNNFENKHWNIEALL